MGRKDNAARGVRLPNALWRSLESEAAALGMSVNELIARRLSHSPSERRKAENIAQDSVPVEGVFG